LVSLHLHVTALGSDTVVKYIRIAPLDGPCAKSIVVQAATARLPGVQPADLMSLHPACGVDSAPRNHKVKMHRNRESIFESVRFGIVANCGGKQVVSWNSDGGLQSWVKQRAFGSADVFDHASAEREEQLLPDGKAEIAALRSGRYDKDCSIPAGLVLAAANLPHLPTTWPGISDYVDPKFPPLAKQAHIEDTVKLKVDVDPVTGVVREV